MNDRFHLSYDPKTSYFGIASFGMKTLLHFLPYDIYAMLLWPSLHNVTKICNRHFVRLDPGPNCLQRLSVDVTSEERVKSGFN